MEDLKKEAPLLEVRHIKKYFPVYGGSLSKLQGYVHAVDDVSFSVEQGETLWPGRRIGLRQKHSDADHHAPDAGYRGQRHL